MKLSTMQVNQDVVLIGEHFILADETVEIALTLKHVNGQSLSVRECICRLGKSSEVKEIVYFKQIEDNIKSVGSKLMDIVFENPLFKGIFIDENTFVTFIIGGIFDSF